MSTNPRPQADIWQRADWLWKAIFILSVLTSTALFIANKVPGATPQYILGLSAGLLLWHEGGMWLAYRGENAWEKNVTARFIVLLGDILIWYLLVSVSPLFYIALTGLFGQVFRHLPIRYAAAATLLLVTSMAINQLEDSGKSLSLTNTTLWMYLFMGGVIVLLGMWISAIIEQSTQRRELIEKLEAAQAELSAAERREGILEERQRLAGEIHDTLAQGFTSIVMLLESAEQALGQQAPPTATQPMKLARETARSSLEQARRLVWELRPEALEQGSLPEALQRVCTAWQERSGLPTSYITTGEAVNLHPQLEITLLRALQEALHNTEKHAAATAVNVTLSYMNDSVSLDVADDGNGFDLAQPIEKGHFGLAGMRERVEKLGGSLLIESDAGSGTALAVLLPIREPA